MIRCILAAFGVVFALAGCQSAGVFKEDGFHSNLYPYSVAYADPKGRAILGEDWLVENYYSTVDGMPTKPKTDSEYRRTLEIELQTGRKTTLRLDAFDLLLVHKVSTAAIWLRTIPVSSRDAKRSLRVVADQYAEGLSGTGFFARDLGRLELGSREYASRVVEGHEVTVAGLAAYDATIDVSNVDQLKLDPTSRFARIRVLFAHAPFTRTGLLIGTDSDREKLPTMLMIGYVNSPPDFDAQQPEFERFLGLIETGGVRGFQREKATEASAPSAPTNAAAPAPPSSAAPPPVPATSSAP